MYSKFLKEKYLLNKEESKTLPWKFGSIFQFNRHYSQRNNEIILEVNIECILLNVNIIFLFDVILHYGIKSHKSDYSKCSIYKLLSIKCVYKTTKPSVHMIINKMEKFIIEKILEITTRLSNIYTYRFLCRQHLCLQDLPNIDCYMLPF